MSNHAEPHARHLLGRERDRLAARARRIFEAVLHRGSVGRGGGEARP